MAMLTLEEAAIRLGITLDELRAKAKSGAIRSLRDGSNLMFKEEEISKHTPPPAAANPLVPDFTLDFDSSDELAIPEGSPIQTGSSDAHLVSESADESSFEFSLPDDVGIISTPAAVTPKAPAAADPGSDKFELHNPPGDPGSSDILQLDPIGDQDDSSSDFALEVNPDSGSSSDFVTTIGNEIEENFVAAEIIESDETQMGDLFELSDSGNEQTIAFTPSPDDSSSEFDLGISPMDGQADGTSSEFDLSIETDGVAPSDSAVFETDYSGLGEADSGSEVVAIDGLDSSLEGSDDGTGSEVVPIDEYADDAAATIQPGDEIDSEELPNLEIGEITGVDEEDADGEPAGYVGPRSVSPAVETPWGAVPASILLITVPLLFFGALISVEMLRSVWAYNRGFAATRPVIRAVSDMVGVKIND